MNVASCFSIDETDTGETQIRDETNAQDAEEEAGTRVAWEMNAADAETSETVAKTRENVDEDSTTPKTAEEKQNEKVVNKKGNLHERKGLFGVQTFLESDEFLDWCTECQMQT